MKTRPFGKHGINCSKIGFGAWAIAQAEANCGVSDLPDPSPDLLKTLQRHNWRRAMWYGGK